MDNSVQAALKQVKELYDIYPDKVEITFSKKGLMPWEGAATWIDEKAQATVQIRPKLPLFYDKKELIAHELVHVARAHLDESCFEEFIAYKTSKNKVRAFLGSLIERPYETYLFLTSVLLQWFFFPLPFIIFFLALCRGFWRHFQWNRSCRALLPFLKDGVKPEFVLFRLKDASIKAIGKMSPKELSSFLKTEPSIQIYLNSAI